MVTIDRKRSCCFPLTVEPKQNLVYLQWDDPNPDPDLDMQKFRNALRS